MRLRVSAFWQAVIVVVSAWLLFHWAFPPFMPRSLMMPFMIITVVGLILFYSSDDSSWTEFKAPITATLRDDNRVVHRWSLLILIPLLLGYAAYDAIKPSLETPLELRQIHPAPPAVLQVYNETYDLATLESPVRTRVIEQFSVGDLPGGSARRKRSLFPQLLLLPWRSPGGTRTFRRGSEPAPYKFPGRWHDCTITRVFPVLAYYDGWPRIAQGRDALEFGHASLARDAERGRSLERNHVSLRLCRAGATHVGSEYLQGSYRYER
jgi:hypothetical protein